MRPFVSIRMVKVVFIMKIADYTLVTCNMETCLLKVLCIIEMECSILS